MKQRIGLHSLKKKSQNNKTAPERWFSGAV